MDSQFVTCNKERGYLVKKIFSIFMLLFVLVLPKTVDAHYHPAYLRSISEFHSRNPNWMSEIQDNTRLSQLSIPGTHNTMSNGPGGDIVQNQGLSLNEQLEVGIRFIDIRVAARPNSLTVHHGFVFLARFEDALNTLRTFLQRNPSEAIYMRLKQEHTSVNDPELNRLVNSYLNNPNYKNMFFLSNNANPTLGETRGKIVILRNFEGSSLGIRYPASFVIQDNYHLRTNWDLYDKWLSVKEHLNQANKDNGNRIFINYLSGSGGSFPYFVASGHSSPGTHAGRLATGMTHPGWAGSVPDFPRIDWFLGIATIAFEGTNILTSDYIRNQKLRHVGIVAADFPGEALIHNVIRLNERHINKQSFSIGGDAKASNPSGFARITVEVKGRKILLVKNSDYQFHGSGWNNQRYASIRVNDPSGRILFSQMWNGNGTVIGNGPRTYGTFAQQVLSEGSTIEIYHAEGPWHRFRTSNDGELKTKLGNNKYTYVYMLRNENLELISAT